MSETAATVDQQPGPAGRTVFGHPIGDQPLCVDCGNASRSRDAHDPGVLLYYSLEQGGLALPQATATGIVGAYGGLVYLSTVLGGWLADGCSAWNAWFSTAASW